MELTELRERAKSLKEKIGLSSFPVGVKFVSAAFPNITTQPVRLSGYRYCQALMKARRGNHVILDSAGITCPAAAAAFGFKPLPEGLMSGKGLVGFGITKDEQTGRQMFEGMPRLNQGEIKELYLFPLETANVEPDVVVIEDQIEKLMWVALAYLNAKGGRRVESSTAILQATCVDSTIIPYKKQKMNLSYGCYGCREATDIEPGETVLGFPFLDFERVSEYVDYLSNKAMPNSRRKNAYLTLREKEMHQ